MTNQTDITRTLQLITQTATEPKLDIRPYSHHLQKRQGIHIPSLALQWLINSDRWPTGRITRYTGSFASLFDYQLANWILQDDGIALLFNPQIDLNPNSLSALGKLSPDSEERLLVGHAEVDEEWLRYIHHLAIKGIGKTPLLISTNKKTIDTRSIRCVLNKNPAVTVHISSESTEPSCELNDVALDLRATSGGTSAYNLAFSKTPGSGKDGGVITISNYTPCAGNRKISVPVLTSLIKGENGHNHLCTIFDWGAADAYFLINRYNDIADIIIIESKYVRREGLHIQCDSIDTEGFVPAAEFGHSLLQSLEVMELLQKELGIEIS